MSKKNARSCADTELGSYHKAVGYIQPNVITRLRDMAGQENCDGEPYDTMQEAAEKLNNLIEAAENTSYMIEQYMKGNQTTVGLLSSNMRLKKAIKEAKNDQP